MWERDERWTGLQQTEGMMSRDYGSLQCQNLKLFYPLFLKTFNADKRNLDREEIYWNFDCSFRLHITLQLKISCLLLECKDAKLG